MGGFTLTVVSLLLACGPDSGAKDGAGETGESGDCGDSAETSGETGEDSSSDPAAPLWEAPPGWPVVPYGPGVRVWTDLDGDGVAEIVAVLAEPSARATARSCSGPSPLWSTSWGARVGATHGCARALRLDTPAPRA